MSYHASPDADKAFDIMTKYYDFDTVLDIGCGRCKYSDKFIQNGKTVTATDFSALKDYVIEGDYGQLHFDQHDAIWCSHVLEHQVDTHTFLKKLVSECKEGGVIAITVPPLKNQIVGGHVSLWNAGLLLYRMILSGLDCSQAKVGTYGYSISVVTQKKSIQLPQLTFGGGDIEKLSQYFPMPVKQGFDGHKLNINWS